MFAVRAAESATTTLPTLMVWLAVRSRWPHWFGIPVDLIFAVVAGAVVLGLVAAWWRTRFTVDVAGVTFEKGTVVRRSTTVAWSEVVSVQVSRSAAGRALGCARVLIGIGAESQSSLIIEAVPDDVAAEIEDCFVAGRDRPSMSTPTVRTPDDGEVIYRIGARDYFMLSVTYGQFLLVVPFVLGVCQNVADLPWIASALPSLSNVAPSPRVLVGVGLLVGVPAAIGFGMSVAWLRYRSFEVRLERGVYAMSGGLVSAESRQVSQSQVAGIRIQQNPLMRATGFARLGVVSRQSGERIGANILFPAVSLAFLRDGMATQFPLYAAAAARPCKVSRGLGWGLVVCDAAVLLLAYVLVAGMPVASVVAVMSAIALALLVVTNYCWAAAELDTHHGVISFRRGFLWVTHYVVPCDSVYFVQSWQVSLSSRLTVAMVCVGLFSSRAVLLRVPVARPILLDQFAAATATATLSIQGETKS